MVLQNLAQKPLILQGSQLALPAWSGSKRLRNF